MQNAELLNTECEMHKTTGLSYRILPFAFCILHFAFRLGVSRLADARPECGRCHANVTLEAA